MRVESLRLEWIEALIDGCAGFTERDSASPGSRDGPDSPKLSHAPSTPPAATTATGTLIDWARDLGAARAMCHTLATPNASTAVPVHCGFTHIATIAGPRPRRRRLGMALKLQLS
jgi:hypothetical protein